MKKIILIQLVFIFIGIHSVSANIRCDLHYESYELYYDKYLKENENSIRKNEYFDKAENNLEAYNNCYSSYEDDFNKGYQAYESGEYMQAIEYFKEALKTYPDDAGSLKNLSLSLEKMAIIKWGDGEQESSINYYKEAILYSQSQESIDDMQFMIESLEKSPTNDSLSWTQYYLHSMNIPKAWEKIQNNNKVIVAVIDDGIYLNHHDLEGKIWEDENSKYGQSKVINFTGDDLDNLAAGEHGTMVAGIIAAEQNNKEGIAGIAKNVEIMPIRVFDLQENSGDILGAIKYAIDNGADIINLSLGQTQFKYNLDYDSIIKEAYEKGIIVVIAAGNGDILSNQETGINLTENPISPVCNNGGNFNKYSIGVYASDSEGYRTNWSNYGDCTELMAPGEGIVSTSIPVFNQVYGDDYNILDGTSFSAPIISGIVALGYNEFGRIPPDIVYDSLINARRENDIGNLEVDAAVYIEILGNYYDESENNRYLLKKNEYKVKFDKIIGEKLEDYPESVLKSLIVKVDFYLEKEVNNDRRAMLEAFIELVEDKILLN